MLHFGKLFLEQADVVVVDHGQRADNAPGGPARGFAHQLRPDQIAECLGSVGVSAFVDEIVKLAFPTPPSGANILYTVSYEDGPKANPQGSLKEGGTVEVKDGMIFNVTATDKS